MRTLVSSSKSRPPFAETAERTLLALLVPACFQTTLMFAAASLAVCANARLRSTRDAVSVVRDFETGGGLI